MGRDLKTPTEPSAAPASAPAHSPADMQNAKPAPLRPLAIFAIAALIVLSAWLAWQLYGPEDRGDPIANSLIALEKQNRLTVFSAEVAPVVSSSDSRYFGTVNSKQVAVIPARVDYSLDMSKLDRSRMAWDETTKTLTVRLPPVQIGKPNLDEARAQYLREGIWITRDAQDKMTRDNTLLAEQQARKQAANPVLLGLARNAAKDALRQNLAVPLAVAGYDEASINVNFDNEPANAAQAKESANP